MPPWPTVALNLHLPATGDYAPGGFVLLAMGLGGAITALVGVLLVIVSRRQRNEVIR